MKSNPEKSAQQRYLNFVEIFNKCVKGEFKVLPKYYQLEYINIWYSDVTEEMLEAAQERYSLDDAFDFGEEQWQEVREELEGGKDA